jgi:predicted phage replisome organizer
MAEVKWIKLTTDMFDNRKIKHLRRLPEGNNIVLIWVMLLTMAGRCNASGMIFLTENIPYTPKMLADELDFEENTVVLALKALEDLNMVVTNNGYFAIAGWEEYQNIEGMDKIREQNRLRKQKQRESQKLLPDMSRDCHVTVTQCHATDKEEDIDKDIEEENIIRAKTTKFIPPSVEEVADYCFERGNTVNPETFVDFYSAKGWMLGKNKMKDWKAAVRTWERKEKEQPNRTQKSNYVDSIKNRVTDVDNW